MTEELRQYYELEKKVKVEKAFFEEMTEGIKFYPHPPETHRPSESADSLGNENDTKSNAEKRIQSISDAPNDMLKDRLVPEPCYAQRQAHIRCTIGGNAQYGLEGFCFNSQCSKIFNSDEFEQSG
ncbi:hypothetical protein AAP_02826 [Ascosphaera apis ARSEF 7405]|uniref:Uncharacterized protein n=1 Tax=Ascosphaera apis ARSEF 7405 TaxID=392613 RepID=A0A167ZJM3_9EURO|nr:hypothetical protein AAP_02826 [Ascosphaera apis ARSEF 7405]